MDRTLWRTDQITCFFLRIQAAQKGLELRKAEAEGGNMAVARGSGILLGPVAVVTVVAVCWE